MLKKPIYDFRSLQTFPLQEVVLIISSKRQGELINSILFLTYFSTARTSSCSSLEVSYMASIEIVHKNRGVAEFQNITISFIKVQANWNKPGSLRYLASYIDCHWAYCFDKLFTVVQVINQNLKKAYANSQLTDFSKSIPCAALCWSPLFGKVEHIWSFSHKTTVFRKEF